MVGLDFVSSGPSRELLLHFNLNNFEKFGVRGKPKGKRQLQTFFFEIKDDAYGSKNKKKFKPFLSFEILTPHAVAISNLLMEYEKAAIHESFRKNTLKSSLLKPDRLWRDEMEEQTRECACVLLQAIARGYLVRSRTHNLLDNHAALLIQTAFRRHRAYAEVERLRTVRHSE